MTVCLSGHTLHVGLQKRENKWVQAMEMQHYLKAEAACNSRSHARRALGLDSMAFMAVGQQSEVQRAAEKYLRDRGIEATARPAAIILRGV